MSNCIICSSFCSDGLLLSSGAVYHKECYEGLLIQKSELSNRYHTKAEEINRLEKKLKSFYNKILNYFFINTTSINEIENKLSSDRRDLKLIEISATDLSNKIISLYDFWLDYPPDWEERRRGLLNESSCCQQCYRGYESKITLDIHHKIPIAKGGNHKKINLIVLCRDCHQTRHKHSFLDTFNTNKINPFEKKLYLIREAIELRKRISFDYTKYEGEKSSRTIKPEEFKKVQTSLCIRGYCYLRRDYRTFAIRRMNNLKIIE